MSLQDEMFKLVKEWKASGLTQTNFLKGVGISKSKFNYWTQKFLRQNTKAKGRATDMEECSDFEQVMLGRAHHDLESTKFIETITPKGFKITLFE